MPEQTPGANDDPVGGGGPDHPGRAESAWPEKRFQASRAQRTGNSVVSALTQWGLVPHTYVMTTRGRKTGALRSTPVTLVEEDGRKWMVAPYGPVPWVLNVREAGRVTLRRRGQVAMYTVRELPYGEAGSVLKKYLSITTATGPYFTATKDSPVAAFIAEANKHPAFELTLAHEPRAIA